MSTADTGSSAHEGLGRGDGREVVDLWSTAASVVGLGRERERAGEERLCCVWDGEDGGQRIVAVVG